MEIGTVGIWVSFGDMCVCLRMSLKLTGDGTRN